MRVQPAGLGGAQALAAAAPPIQLAVFFARDVATGLFRLRFKGNDKFWSVL